MVYIVHALKKNETYGNCFSISGDFLTKRKQKIIFKSQKSSWVNIEKRAPKMSIPENVHSRSNQFQVSIKWLSMQVIESFLNEAWFYFYIENLCTTTFFFFLLFSQSVLRSIWQSFKLPRTIYQMLPLLFYYHMISISKASYLEMSFHPVSNKQANEITFF